MTSFTRAVLLMLNRCSRTLRQHLSKSGVNPQRVLTRNSGQIRNNSLKFKRLGEKER